MQPTEQDWRQQWQMHSVLEARRERGWNQLASLNSYRVVVAFVLILVNFIEPRWRPFGQSNPAFFFLCGGLYLTLSLVSVALIYQRWLNFSLQRSILIVSDIVFITLMMMVSGGVRSGLGLLLLISLASSALIIEGRMLMFYTALAATAMLLTQMIGVATHAIGVTDIGQAGLLGIAFFASSGIAWVMTERNRKSEALADQQAADLRSMAQINQLVIDDMQDGVIVLDGEGRIRQANQRARDLLELPVDALQDEPFPLQARLPVLSRFLEQWRRSPAMRFDAVPIGKMGESYLPRFIAVTNRRVMGAVLVLEDLSRVREAARQMKLAALGRLTANMAHEIRNPLSSISHASELLLESGEANNRRLLEIIVKNTSRINRLISDVMALSRRDRIQRTRVELARFLTDFVEEFCHSSEMPAETFQLQIVDSPVICFDPGHLHQVMTNLCANAIRHGSEKSGSVRIQCGVDRNLPFISVMDDGPGVPAELQSRLFEPFFTTESSGTGLGLYISRELCQANAADLEYEPASGCGHFRIVVQESACQESK